MKRSRRKRHSKYIGKCKHIERMYINSADIICKKCKEIALREK